MTNANRYYLIPFAENGNKAEITDLSVGGAVSYDTGYGPDYELAQGGPNRKRIERTFYNGALNSATKNLKQWQERVFPTWIEDKGDAAPFAYSKNAIVDHNGVYYISLVASNVSTPEPGSEWRVFDFAETSAYTEPLGNKNVYMRTTMVKSPDPSVTFPPTSGATGDYGAGVEIVWGLWSGNGTQNVVISDSSGLSWAVNDVELRYDIENISLFTQGDETVYIVDQSGVKHWLKVSDTTSLTSTLTVNTLAVQVDIGIFAELGITSILQIGLQDALGVFAEVSSQYIINSMQPELLRARTTQDVEASRATGVTYTNTTDTDIFVFATVTGAGAAGDDQVGVSGTIALRSDYRARVFMTLLIYHGLKSSNIYHKINQKQLRRL